MFGTFFISSEGRKPLVVRNLILDSGVNALVDFLMRDSTGQPSGSADWDFVFGSDGTDGDNRTLTALKSPIATPAVTTYKGTVSVTDPTSDANLHAVVSDAPNFGALAPGILYWETLDASVVYYSNMLVLIKDWPEDVASSTWAMSEVGVTLTDSAGVSVLLSRAVLPENVVALNHDFRIVWALSFGGMRTP